MRAMYHVFVGFFFRSRDHKSTEGHRTGRVGRWRLFLRRRTSMNRHDAKAGRRLSVMVQSIEVHVRGFFSVASACEVPRGAGVQRHRCTLARLHGVIRVACNQTSWSRLTTLQVISRNGALRKCEKRHFPAFVNREGVHRIRDLIHDNCQSCDRKRR